MELFSEADLDPEMIKFERQQLERERLAKLEEKKEDEKKEELPFDKKLYILDGYSIIYRSYFAHITSPLLDIKGRNCSAYFGFFQTLFFLMSNYKMDYLAVTMDEKAPTFRHLMYPEYKANREKAPEDLHAQVPWIVETLNKMKITVLSKPGFEADDVIASLTKEAKKNGIETIMVTGDKDLCQLIGDHVFALRPPKKGESKYRLFGSDEVRGEYGVSPEQIVDYLSIIGDVADNVPGIKGLGEKGAVKLLTEYVSFDGIYRHLDSLTPAVRRKLEDGRESGELSRKLITLSFDALPDSFDFSPLSASLIDKSGAAEDFEERKMRALARRAAGAAYDEKTQQHEESSVVEPAQSLLSEKEKSYLLGKGEYEVLPFDSVGKKFDEIASFKGGVISLEFITDSYDINSELLGFAFSYEVKKAYYVPFYEGKEIKVSRAAVKELFDGYCASGKIKVICQNAKFPLKKIWDLSSDIKTLLFDTMIAAWMIDSNSNQYSLLELVLKYFNHTVLNLEDLKGKDEAVSDIPEKILISYASERADYTFRLYRVLERRLHEKGLFATFSDMELPLIRIIAKMENEGIFLSDDRMDLMKEKTDERLGFLVSRIYELAGHEFNINSTMQLGKVLFEEKGLTAGKKTQKGFSTDTATLEAIRHEDEIIEYVLEYRLLNKLKTTYIDVLPALRDENGRIHTTFLQTGTATGRLSSRNPNLQNIPIRTEAGRIIRDAFIPTDGNVFLSADYSQIELVVLAYMTDDPNLKSAFNSGEDVHKRTAASIFGKDIDDVSANERRIAKTINFGIMYGMSAFRLSNELGISRSDAAGFISMYFERYSGVKQFVEKVTEEATKSGYIKTKFGHIRDVIGINSANKTEKAAAERVAVNSIIQGTAAEIMKKAMIDIANAIEERGLSSKLLLQVHDELIFEVPEKEKEEMYSLVKEKMENAVSLTVPVKASLEFGSSWGVMH